MVDIAIAIIQAKHRTRFDHLVAAREERRRCRQPRTIRHNCTAATCDELTGVNDILGGRLRKLTSALR